MIRFFFFVLSLWALQGCHYYDMSKSESDAQQQARLAAKAERATLGRSQKRALLHVVSVESIDETVYLTLHMSSEQNGALPDGLTQAYCLNIETRAFLNSGVIYYFFVFNDLHQLIFEFSISNTQCI
ncbi:TPA: type II secretion system pilot lipoprotein GspS-beta [Vibrio parahaemolyticus]|nr:type II secretion system pilot lipoprotein GspS-beta [Vibrio parahaemolyticus]